VAFSAPKLEHLVELVLNRPPHIQHTHIILSRNDIIRHFNRYSTHTHNTWTVHGRYITTHIAQHMIHMTVRNGHVILKHEHCNSHSTLQQTPEDTLQHTQYTLQQYLSTLHLFLHPCTYTHIETHPYRRTHRDTSIPTHTYTPTHTLQLSKPNPLLFHGGCRSNMLLH
jgi:hypothetical protein